MLKMLMFRAEKMKKAASPSASVPSLAAFLRRPGPRGGQPVLHRSQGAPGYRGREGDVPECPGIPSGGVQDRNAAAAPGGHGEGR